MTDRSRKDTPRKGLTRRTLLRATGVGLTGGTLLGGYAFAVEPALRLKLTRYSFTPSNWTPDLRLRIALVADVHACNPWMSLGRIERIVERTNALAPDLTLLLGDYSAGMNLVTSYVHSRDWAPALAQLRTPLGVFAVLGNHDWWEDKAAQRRGAGPTFGQVALERNGVRVLENETVRLTKDGHGFAVAGLGDQLAFLPHAEYGRTRWLGTDDLPQVTSQLREGEPTILMAHEPDIFPRVPHAVSLTVSGHTHGGQVRLLGHAPVVPSRYGDRYAYGHIVEDGRHLVVSAGLGCSIMPVRFGAPPEIVLLELGEAA